MLLGAGWSVQWSEGLMFEGGKVVEEDMSLGAKRIVLIGRARRVCLGVDEREEDKGTRLWFC